MKKIYNIFFILFLLLNSFNCKKNKTVSDKNYVASNVSLDFFNDSKIYKLLIIISQKTEPYNSTYKFVINNLAKKGLIIGKNLYVKIKSIGNDRVKAKKVLENNLKNKYDVIFINGTVLVRVVEKYYKNKNRYKFVFANVTDPIGVGLITGFNIPPAYNFTGVSYPVPVSARIDFIHKLLPSAKKIGLIYANMPQSKVYKKWIDNFLYNNHRFKNLKIIYRQIPFIKGETGSIKMVSYAIPKVQELNNIVNVFMSPNDQMGVKRHFPKMVYKYGNKPLIGLTRRDVMKKYGALASIYPSIKSIATQASIMIMKLFKGTEIKSIYPQTPKRFGYAFNLKIAKKFNIKIPAKYLELAGNDIIK